MAYKVAGLGTYTLASSISSTATSITLTSFTVPVTGTNITMASMATDIAYGTIAPGTSTAEFISFTGISQNADGTATLTGVTRGLNKQSPYTTSSSFKQPHAGQTKFILSNSPNLYDEFSIIENAETITGKKTFPGGGNANAPVSGTVYSAPTADLEYASKKYVDDTAIAGSPKATDSVYGITKLSVAAVSPTDPIAVGDNDTRVPTQSENDALVGTSGTPSSSNKYVTNDDTATAATASKVARRLGTGDITVPSTPTNSTDAASKSYVDLLSSTLFPYCTAQTLPSDAGTDVIISSSYRTTSESDGSVLYTMSIPGASNQGTTLKRWVRDSNTGCYYVTHSVGTGAWGTGGFFLDSNISLCVLGSYVYAFGYAVTGPVGVMRRFDKSNLANETAMTISGTNYTTATSAFSDGTDLYVYDSSNTYKKYTVSGTTATYSSSITYTSSGVSSGACCDGTNVFLLNSAGQVITKYPKAGGSSTASLTTILTNNYPNPGTTTLFIPKTGYVAFCQAYTITNATANVGTLAQVTPITAI